jgi:hypothetical protein
MTRRTRTWCNYLMRVAMNIIIANKTKVIKKIESRFESSFLRRVNVRTATEGTVKKRTKREYPIRKMKEKTMTMAQLYDAASDRLPLLMRARLNADARWAMNIEEIP